MRPHHALHIQLMARGLMALGFVGAIRCCLPFGTREERLKHAVESKQLEASKRVRLDRLESMERELELDELAPRAFKVRSYELEEYDPTKEMAS